MKYLNCAWCKAYLGEMTKGRIKNGAVVLCDDCGAAAKASLVGTKPEKSFEGGLKSLFENLVK